METRKGRIWEGVLGVKCNGFFEKVGSFNFIRIVWFEPELTWLGAESLASFDTKGKG